MSDEDRSDEGGRDEDDEAVPGFESVDERIRRIEAIVRALEAGEVDPGDRARRIAEGKALVAGLESDLEAVDGVGTGDDVAE